MADPSRWYSLRPVGLEFLDEAPTRVEVEAQGRIEMESMFQDAACACGKKPASRRVLRCLTSS